VISGGEIKIDLDPAKMEAIMKCPIHTNFIEGSFVGAVKYFHNFIASFPVVATRLHGIMGSVKSFQWGKNQQNTFDEIKRNIIQALVISLPNLWNPFKVETNLIGYAMGAILMQG
jgi:hypothetical protein